MSTYVGEIIEVKVNGKWELLKSYHDGDYVMCTDNNSLSDDYIVYNACERNGNDNKTLICKNNDYIDDVEYEQMLLNSMENDLGLPEDVSDETRSVYFSTPNSPSTPSYFTLDELSKLLMKCEDAGFNELENEIENETESLILNRLDYICKKLDNPNVRREYKKGQRTVHSNWKNRYFMLRDDFSTILRHLSRIKAKVMVSCPLVYRNSDVRVIWYIV